MASAPRSARSPARRSPSTGFGREPIFADERAAREFAGSSGARRVGARLRYFESVDSTNARARRLAELGWPEGTVVLAEHQTDGRGRLGRSWVCPPRAGLLVSVILAREGRALRPSSGDAASARPAPAWLTAAGALGMIEAVERSGAAGRSGSARAALTGAAGLLVEWPNDIVASDEAAPRGRRKVGGVLVEARGASQVVILGVGLNVDVRAEEFPPELRAGSGSVVTVFGRDADRRAGVRHADVARLRRGIFGRFLAALESRIDRPRRLAEELRERSFTLGREVELPPREPGGPTRRGRAVGFDEEMRLVVELAGGGTEAVAFLPAQVSAGPTVERANAPGGGPGERRGASAAALGGQA